MAGQRLGALFGMEIDIPIDAAIEDAVVEILTRNEDPGTRDADFTMLDPSDLAAFVQRLCSATGPDDAKVVADATLLAALAGLATILPDFVIWSKRSRRQVLN